MKQIIGIALLLGFCALTVNTLSIPEVEKDMDEHPKLQFYKDKNYTMDQILEDLANDSKLVKSNFDDKIRYVNNITIMLS